MEDKMKEMYEGSMSLYNTIDIEVNEKENTYTNAEDKIKEILNGEEPLYIPEDDELAGMLFQYANVGYAVTGVKYLEMLIKNPNIAVTVLGYTLQVLNQNTDMLIKYQEKYGDLNKDENSIKEEKLQGISE